MTTIKTFLIVTLHIASKFLNICASMWLMYMVSSLFLTVVFG